MMTPHQIRDRQGKLPPQHDTAASGVLCCSVHVLPEYLATQVSQPHG
jgi:hypothetical protein